MKLNVWKLNDLSVAGKARLLRRSEIAIDEVMGLVKPIIEDVRLRGDAALIDYAKKFDKADIKDGIKATDADFARAYKTLAPDVTAAIKFCAGNVTRHHQQQMARVEREWMEEISPGVFGGEKVTPIDSVGIYVPRGKGAFPSMMYMLCVPAKIAGVRTIAVVTPPTPDGGFDDASLVAADVCGVRDVYKAGGAQAIAALAYGTATIPKVAKVEGPGSPYVAAAKRLLSHVIDPGMPAGPSEAIVLADETANAWNTALDMMNEAEHGDDSACLLVTDSEKLARDVAEALPNVLAALPDQRRAYCEIGFSTFGGIMICPNMNAAIDFCNDYAVEHLLIKTRNPEQILPRILNAGEILLGESTPSVLGNFGIGINAVLPTGGAARTHSCTSVWSFLKRSSISYVTPEGYQTLKKPVETLAEYEGFVGHAHVTQKRNETAFKPVNVGLVGKTTKT